MGMLSYGQRGKCADLLEVMDNCNIQRLKYESDCRQRETAAFKNGRGNGDKTHHGPDKRDPVQYASE